MKKEIPVEAGGIQDSPASPVSLETMIGKHSFEIKGHFYVLIPIKLKDLSEFRDKNDKVLIPYPDQSDGFMQFAYLQDDQYIASVDKWLQKQLLFNDQPVTYEMVMEHDWDVDDLGRFFKEMVRVSG